MRLEMVLRELRLIRAKSWWQYVVAVLITVLWLTKEPLTLWLLTR